MTERLPDNLKVLYEGFSKEAIDTILSGDTFTVDDVEFVCRYMPGSTASRFFIVKNLGLVDLYRTVCAQFQGAAIFELGIAEGGSTALLALLARPRKIIAVDLEPEPLPALTEFAENHGLAEVVRPYYGIDQGDHARLTEILDDELGPGRTLDLVIDDASHDLGLTRRSFETLFPRLTPGGLYMIEDWRKDHIFRDGVIAGMRNPNLKRDPDRAAEARAEFAAAKRGEAPKPKAPLSQIAIELVLARAAIGDVVDEVSVGEFTVTVRRGPGELPDSFRVADLFIDYFGFLPKNVQSETAGQRHG